MPIQLDEAARTVLSYVRSEEVCSRFELEQCAVLQGSSAQDAAAMITNWLTFGWLEAVDIGEAEPAMLLRLTDAGDETVRRFPAS